MDVALLGEATQPRQLAVMAASACFWELLRRVSLGLFEAAGEEGSGSPLAVPRHSRKDLAVSVVSTLHALLICVLCLAVITTEKPPDSLYHRIDLSQVTFAVAAGYFLWDLCIVLFVDKFDLAFLIHAVACLLCYVFGQYPFLNYWGVYFLLFELSTPLLNVRKAMILLGKGKSEWFPIVEQGFGLSFFIARILIGLPMSAMVWRDLLSLLRTSDQVHSHFIVYYYFAANAALCILNLIWFSKMVQKFFRPPKTTKKA